MPVVYKVEPNALTTPPSYSCRTVPQQTLGIDEIGALINLKNPTIPAQTAIDVIQKFAEEVLAQLADGNWVNINTFCSFTATLPVRLDTATQTLPANAIEIRAKPSAPFKTQLRQQASYSRIPYVEKSPNVSEAFDTNSEIANWVRDGYGVRINGSNLGFDASNSDLGVWIETADGVQVKQTKLSLNNPSSVILTPDFEASLPDGEHVALNLIMKNKYTENGQIRSTTTTNRLRATNTTFNLFASGLGASPATVSLYAGADKTVKFVASLTNLNVLQLSVGEVGKAMGSSIDVTESTPSVVLPGLGDDVTVTINDYATLYQTVLDYQRYMGEINTLTATP